MSDNIVIKKLTTIGGSSVNLDTNNFDNILSVADNTVQKAFDTIDNLSQSQIETALGYELDDTGTATTDLWSADKIQTVIDAAVAAEDFWQRTGTTVSFQNAGDSLDIDGGAIFNSDSGDNDFTVNKNTSGSAYVYDAGLDTHTFSQDVIVNDLTASKPVWTDANKTLISKDITPCDLVKTRKTANSMSVVTGTLTSGTVTDTQTWQDGNIVDVTEVTGVPGFDVQFTFTSVTDFCEIGISAYYVGSATHVAEIQIYDYTNTTWRTLYTLPGTSMGFNYRFSDLPIPVATRQADYINGSDEVLIRFYHPTTGNASHDLYIDYVSIVG